MLHTDRTFERGFSYLEVLIASALTIGVVLAASGAVANALHGAARSEEQMALTDDALGALADVRAIVAYGDGNAADRSRQLLPQLFGRAATRTVTRADGSAETISIALDPAPPGATQTLASVTASADGVSVTERQIVFYESPTPGSSVTEP